ncbi:hypothetical protein [Cardiobacterium hominis]
MDDKDDVGGMLTIEGVAAYTTTFTLTKSKDGGNLGTHMGIGVDGDGFAANLRHEEDAKGAPTMIRVNLREIPL